MKSSQENSAALRAFRILEVIAESARPLPLADIVDKLDLPKQTVHRILKQMQDSWLITRSPGSRNYSCSSRVNRFAVNVMLNSGVAAVRHAILRDLVEQIGETCNLTMLSGTNIVYIDRVETQWALRVHLPVAQGPARALAEDSAADGDIAAIDHGPCHPAQGTGTDAAEKGGYQQPGKSARHHCRRRADHARPQPCLCRRRRAGAGRAHVAGAAYGLCAGDE